MDVSKPIVSVIPSLDGPVLGALAGSSAPMTLTEVHRIAGRGSLAGVRRVLRRLVSVGLAHDVPGGYLLNRDHLAAPAVELLAGLHGQLIARIREHLDGWPGDVVAAGIFGSAARRDGDENSDIDVLVVSDSPGLAELVESLAERIHAWTGNHAQVIARTKADVKRLRDAGEPIVASWDRDLFVVVGDERALRTAA